jgi:hypothetical protein
MPETGHGVDDADRLSVGVDAFKDAWAATLEDMEALAEEYESEGWDTLTIAAGDTAPEPPDAGDDDRFGLVHTIPDDDAEAFTEAVEPGEFPRYDVFRNESDGRVFLVTVLADPETSLAVLIAGSFERRHAPALVNTVMQEGEMYTHVQTLDSTQVGTFRHDDPEKFFPEAEIPDQ